MRKEKQKGKGYDECGWMKGKETGEKRAAHKGAEGKPEQAAAAKQISIREALRLYEGALERLERVVGDDNPLTLAAMQGHADVLLKLKRPDEAKIDEIVGPIAAAYEGEPATADAAVVVSDYADAEDRGYHLEGLEGRGEKEGERTASTAFPPAFNIQTPEVEHSATSEATAPPPPVRLWVVP
jgi:hypothetical protein